MIKPIQDRREQARREREERLARYKHWLEHGSDNLADAWVSLCAHGHTHDVEPIELSEVVDMIRTGGPVTIKGKLGPRSFYLDENQEKVRRLYETGRREAEILNRPRIKRLLEEELGLSGTDPHDVEVIYDQPKGNTKLFYISALTVNGVSHPIRQRVVYHLPYVLGKMRANDAKTWTPAVTLGGLFLGQRNKEFLARTSGLYAVDLDDLADLAATKAQVMQDEHAPLVFTSISGSGLCACVWGPTARDAAEYEDNYKLIAPAFCRKYGVEAKMDEQTYDVSRLRFLAYDEEISFKP